MDWGAAALDGAVSAMSEFTDAQFGLINIASDAADAYDGWNEAIKENGKTLDVNTDKGRKNLDALEDVARTLDTKLAAAYKDAGGDMDKFREKAGAISDEAISKLMPALKNSGISADQLADMLGLLPEDIETRYKLSGNAEAMTKLGLLQGAIDALPKDVQTNVTQHIITGDYVGALNIVQGYYNRNPAEIPTEATAPSNGNLAAVGAAVGGYFKRNPVKVTTTVGSAFGTLAGGGVAGPDGGIAGEAGAEFAKAPGRPTVLLHEATVVPPGTKVTSAKRTRQILTRRLPRYANGTGQPAPTPVLTGLAGRPMHFTYEQNAPVYGVDDLDRHLAAWSQRIAQTISVGRRN